MRFVPCFLLVLSSVFAQQEYPKDYFRQPLDITMELSGNFGELRSNHFHAGFDFRTQQKEGLNVYAAADGYISRIKISSYGYGKAIYITHPNGFTTLYGHLRSGAGKVEAYIKAQQYKDQAFEIEVLPAPNELPITKGEVIAYSGNTGGSQGPHLHFEIRDSATEKAINPIFFGFAAKLPDTKRPVISDLVVYPLDDDAVVNKSSVPIVVNLTPQGNGQYSSEKIFAKSKIGFGINTYDSNNNSSNRNGVYGVKSFLNGKPIFGYEFDTFAFDESRYINALLDYSRFRQIGQRVQKLFMKQKFPLSIIDTDSNNGIINVQPNTTGVYRVEVTDYHGNLSTISVNIEHSPEAPLVPVEKRLTPFFLEAAKDHNYEKDNISVFFPAGTFYEDFYLDFDVRANSLYLNNKNIPVHSNFTVSIKDTLTSDADRKKTFIALVDGKKLTYNSTFLKDGYFTAKLKALGKISLAKDDTAPVISMAKSITGKWITNQRTLDVYIKDDLSGIREYNGWLNGKWILFEYDYKARKLTHVFADNIVLEGRNELKVTVSDNAGNSAIFETHFFRSQ
ncbi:MAG TPA: M23 family metallopeptidase [Flavobacterium sp.]|jgi:murein DD-endopeptidase MepM/ murein hydrolase activator NlpD